MLRSTVESHVHTSWKPVLLDFLTNKHSEIESTLSNEYEKFDGALEIFPPKNLIFNAFNHFDVQDTNVVILGQDVYPTKGHGMGLCFSVPQGVKCAASLKNIFKELDFEYGKKRNDTDLTNWADQGVLLLNRALTVREGSPMSHMKIWQAFTQDIIKYITENTNKIVYILWGQQAQQLEKYIDKNENLVLKSVHPSPLAQTRDKSFFGNNHFKQCNEYLAEVGKKEINWIT